MARKRLAAAILLLAMAPAAHLAWVAREMPHFGHLHDDSIYWVSAKSLAEGRGYRILSLPGEPFQTKYPPLWPLMLSGIWKIDPRFPENLVLAGAMAFAILPLFLATAWLWLRRAGFGGPAVLAICCIMALSPPLIFFSTSLLSDSIFSVAVIAALLEIERAGHHTWRAGTAAALGAAAYLIKTAALPLLAAGPLWLLLRKKYRAAAVFFSGMLPAVIWWTLWTRLHLRHAADTVSLYYTDYLGYRRYCLGWRDLPLVIWKNLDSMFSGIAGLVMFGLTDAPWGLHLSRILAIGAIAGVVRLARQRGVTPYHWFAAGYVAILLIWHFPPNERFLLPLFPLFLAGFSMELAHLARGLRAAWACGTANRMVAAGIAAALAAVACLGIQLDFRALHHDFPIIIEQSRTVLASNRAAFAWADQHLPAGAFYAYDDPVFYLYTGRHATSLPMPPIPFYREDRKAILGLFRRMPAFTREQHLAYLLLTAADFHRDLPGTEREEARQILASQREFEPLYRSPLSTIYRFH